MAPTEEAPKPAVPGEIRGILPRDTKIMIVEDSQIQAKSLLKTLTDLGYRQIVVCVEPDKALETLVNEKVRVVLSDWDMPTLSGIELLKQMRADPRSAKVPFIFLTAHADKQCVIEAVKTGADSYMVKPPSPAIVEENLRIAGKLIMERRAAKSEQSAEAPK